MERTALKVACSTRVSHQETPPRKREREREQRVRVPFSFVCLHTKTERREQTKTSPTGARIATRDRAWCARIMRDRFSCATSGLQSSND